MRGVFLCGHGSRDKNAVREFADLTTRLDKDLKDDLVDYGYLEFAQPIIYEGLDALIKSGASEIIALPGMLFAAGHAKNDIPSVLNRYMAERQNGVKIRYGRHLGISSGLLAAAADRICSSLAGLSQMEFSDTLLVVIGRGSSDPDANSDVAKVTRLIWESLGFGWSLTGYSGVTFPLVEPCLEHAVSLGYKRIIVFPYFLFGGILVDRIYHYTDKVARRHSEIEFIKAGYLGCHEGVIATFKERLEEIDSGDNVMNCQLCKYRRQIIGFESELGLAQSSHHHHVEGICTDAKSDTVKIDAGKEAVHSHGNHHPYPHRSHPLGPLSMQNDGKKNTAE